MFSACGSDDGDAAPATDSASDTSDAAAAAPGVRVVSPDEAAEIQADPPDGLVVLDVRTPEEFAEGHLEGAVLLDIYRDDFAEELATFDRELPYLLYCRSGNRSEQARVLMTDLEFSDVADIDGGIVAWAEAGYPVVTI